MRNIFHEITEFFSYFLKLINAAVIDVICMKYLIDKFCLHLYFRYVCNAGDTPDTFKQISAGFSVFLTHKVCKFYAIHKGIKAHRTRLVIVRKNQRSKLFTYYQCIFICQRLIICLNRIQVNIFQMLSYRKVFTRKFLYLTGHHLYQRITIRYKPVYLIFKILQLICDLKLQIKDCTLKRNHICSWFSFTHAKELEVTAEIKNIKLTLISPINESWAKSSTTSDHLPELGIAHYFLKEHKVQYFRYIDTGIHHIYGYCDLRKLVRLRKLINKSLSIVDPIVDYLGKSVQMRVIFIEDFKDFFRMIMILGKNDRLSKLLTIIYLDTFGHNCMQHLPDGILIKNP